MALPQKKSTKRTYFGQNLKFLRNVRKLTQTDLAKSLELSRSKIASYESNVAEPNLKTFLKICAFFEVSPETLITDTIYDLTPTNPENSLLAHHEQQIADFIQITNEAAQIYEGFKEWYALQLEKEISEELESLHSTLDNLLQMLEMIIQSNWALIKSLNISLEEE